MGNRQHTRHGISALMQTRPAQAGAAFPCLPRCHCPSLLRRAHAARKGMAASGLTLTPASTLELPAGLSVAGPESVSEGFRPKNEARPTGAIGCRRDDRSMAATASLDHVRQIRTHTDAAPLRRAPSPAAAEGLATPHPAGEKLTTTSTLPRRSRSPIVSMSCRRSPPTYSAARCTRFRASTRAGPLFG